jgi:hypothetical protein
MSAASALLCAGSLVFAVSGVRTARGAVSSTRLIPVATVDQIMDAIVIPSSTVIFKSVATTYTANGAEEHRPQTDEQWADVAAHAAALAEAGNLLLMDGRAVDDGEWARHARGLTDAARAALAAAAAKDPERLLTAGGTLDEVCDACHEKYQQR